MKEAIQKIYTFLSLESYIALAVVCTLVAYVVSGYDRVAEYVLIAVVVCGVLPLVYEIVHSIIHKRFGVDLIALLAIVAALLIGEYAAAGLILLMLSGGEALERYAEGKARSSLKDLVEHMPTTAHRIVNGVITECARSDIHVSDVVLVRSQEVVPVDGTILEGSSVVDESMITGEPIPREVATNARVYAGSVNQGEPLHIRVEKEHDETTYASIIRLVKEAEETKAPLVRLADRYSVIFTAITLTLAGIAYFVLHSSYLAVAVLVVATPCPLILAAPIAFIAGMSRAAKRGVIVKHGGVFEGVARAQIFMFDKTGTLTFGVPQVSRIVALTRSEEELLTRASDGSGSWTGHDYDENGNEASQ
jgi:cation transport ATPase